MKVFAVIYKAEFNGEEFDEIYIFNTFEKAHENFIDIVSDWFDEELFNTNAPCYEKDNEYWNDDKYNGAYFRHNNDAESIYIEENDNVVNYLNVRIEQHEVQ